MVEAMASKAKRALVVGMAAGLLLLGGAASAQAQLAYSKDEYAVACSGAAATAAIGSAIDQKADPEALKQIAQQGHCVSLPPDVGFTAVKTIHMDTETGGIDEVVGEVTLQDGSRSRFYVMQSDIAKTPPNDPNANADPRPAAPADFGKTLYDGKTRPEPTTAP